MFKALQHIKAKSYKLRVNLVDFGGTCRISGSGKTLKVQTLGCARRSLRYQSTLDRLMRSRLETMNSTRDTRFILVRATIAV